LPRVKTILNRLIDDVVHPEGAPKEIAQILADEALHTLVEGEFRPDKFIRYTLLPNLQPQARGRQQSRRKPRTVRGVLRLPNLQPSGQSHKRTRRRGR